MNRLSAYFIVLISLFVCACNSESALAPTSGREGVSVTIDAMMPEFVSGTVSSRGFDDYLTTDNLKSLSVHILVFDADGAMLQYLYPGDIELSGINAETKSALFKVKNINSSHEKRIIHIIVSRISDLSDSDIVMGGDNLTARTDECSAVANLVVGNDDNVYWGRVEIPSIESDCSVKVGLLRNFAKIKVEYSGKDDRFHPTGYSVVNRPSLGTVAPFLTSDNRFARFFTEALLPMNYVDVLEMGYHGIEAGGIMLNSKPSDIEADIEARTLEIPTYMYENPVSGIQRTYMILKGVYDGNVCYYRIDLCESDAYGEIAWLDILRNFEYTVKVGDISSPGYSTVEEAMNGVSLNSSLVGIVTRDLFSINSLGHSLEVNTDEILLTPGVIGEVRFRYTVTGNNINTSLLCVTDGEDVAVVATPNSFISLGGDMIESVTLLGPDSDGWYKMRIRCADNADNTQWNLRIFYDVDGGLEHTVSVKIRKPQAGGEVLHDDRSHNLLFGIPNQSTDTSGEVGENVNIYYHIPSGLEKSMFPLTFVFESDKRNISPAANSSLYSMVLTKSGFTGGTSDCVIAFSHTVDWADYEAYSSDGLWIVNPFVYTTSGEDDCNYDTSGIDRYDNTGREDNDGQSLFAVRISELHGYIQPVIDNIERRGSYVPVMYDFQWIDWDKEAYTENYHRPSHLGRGFVDDHNGAIFSFYYQVPQNIPKEAFGEEGIVFTITSSERYLKYDSEENRPFSLNILFEEGRASSKIATQVLTWEEYSRPGARRMIIAPFSLSKMTSSGSKFSITVSADCFNEKSIDLERQ